MVVPSEVTASERLSLTAALGLRVGFLTEASIRDKLET